MSNLRRPGIPRCLATLSLLAATALTGCSDDPVTTPPGGGDPTTVDVTVDPGDAAFEVRSAMAEGPGGSFPGPLVIRGSNLHYDAAEGALVVDLVIVNAGNTSLPEPIALVFVDLIPGDVTVLDADNDETGPGAKIFFEFANDDAMWTPGEESFPRTVSFGVDEGQSLAFAARLQAGMSEGGGRIGGVVWHDRNGNGEREATEPGIRGVPIALTTGFGPKRSTETNEEGRYVFAGLGVGTYTVIKLPRPRLEPTTPRVLTVLLTEVDGEVGSFLHADFGCRVHADDGPVLEVGVLVDAGGAYRDDPHRIVARRIVVKHDDDGNEGDDGGTLREGRPHGAIRGPVTDIALADRALQIMGTWFRVAEGTPHDSTDTPWDNTGTPNGTPGDSTGACHDGKLDLEEIEVGDRVLARVVLTDAMSPNEPHIIVGMACWKGEHEGVAGPIEAIVDPDLGPGRFIRVLHTTVMITPDTHIEWGR